MKWLLNRAALLLCGGTLAYASAPLWRLLGGNAVWTIWTITLLSNVDWLRRYLRRYLRRRRERRVIALQRLHRVLRRLRDRVAAPASDQ